jgi:hypothetical protein
MCALTTIQRVLYPSCGIGLSDALRCRDWGIAECDQPIRTYGEKK